MGITDSIVSAYNSIAGTAKNAAKAAKNAAKNVIWNSANVSIKRAKGSNGGDLLITVDCNETLYARNYQSLFSKIEQNFGVTILSHNRKDVPKNGSITDTKTIITFEAKSNKGASNSATADPAGGSTNGVVYY